MLSSQVERHADECKKGGGARPLAGCASLETVVGAARYTSETVLPIPRGSPFLLAIQAKIAAWVAPMECPVTMRLPQFSKAAAMLPPCSFAISTSRPSSSAVILVTPSWSWYEWYPTLTPL